MLNYYTLFTYFYFTCRGLAVNGRAEVSLRSDGCAGGGHGSDVRRVEHVQAVITLTSSRRGHVQLYLTSPGGTRSTLLAPRSGLHHHHHIIVLVKSYRLPILVTERWSRGWSRCTGSQPAGDLSHPPGGRLPLLSARPAVTFPAAEHHRRLAGTHFTVPQAVKTVKTGS